ncbi:fumarylacetoacetase [Candidimonas humi]|uniref:fumarylacetoacetase n=1 Tax=Candidimonas humi TaxID=683355 RepID=A0ABV8NTS0_9BURK|nr:fumarylacetoacetase [Candidimonas humi]MBV6305194.1 fumarylacetoacetase [Candidimonas humi]
MKSTTSRHTTSPITAFGRTLDPALQSWVPSANLPDTDFPIQNLPFGVFKNKQHAASYRCGIAIGDQILDLAALMERNLLTGTTAELRAAVAQDSLNALMALGPEAGRSLRIQLSGILEAGAAHQAAVRDCLVPQAEAQMALPARIGDFSDFYASLDHATNVGKQFRPDNPVLPNFKWLPVAYHGRASSIRPSGHPVYRPNGQKMKAGAARPEFGPSERLDYEAEIGFLVGSGNPLGHAVGIDDAEKHVFGLCILNDWSARDIQSWEYQPLGPFLAKSFMSTLSPWVVTLDALEPFRSGWQRGRQDPPLLEHLSAAWLGERGAIDVRLQVSLQSRKMHEQRMDPMALSTSLLRDSYWTVAQIMAHHTSNGCNLQPGDLLGSGTVSGPSQDTLACLLEQTQGGKHPITLPTGETRLFLEDGDTVIMKAWCEAEGRRRLGFGECRGTIMAAPARI